MNTPLPCGAQDKLEAAIVQKRRLDMVCLNQAGEKISYRRVLPIDINSQKGVEWLHFIYADVDNNIRRVQVNTAQIVSFQAVDEQQPNLRYQRS